MLFPLKCDFLLSNNNIVQKDFKLSVIYMYIEILDLNKDGIYFGLAFGSLFSHATVESQSYKKFEKNKDKDNLN